MDTTTNTPNDQLSGTPNLNQLPNNLNQSNQAKPANEVNQVDQGKAIALQDAQPTDAQKANCEMLNADPKVLGGEAVDANVKADAGADANVPAEGGHKREQLYRRVIARVGEIEKELASLQGNAVKSEHASALRVELDIAKDAMSGGWDHVGQIEAARLSKWLETSQTLIGSGPTDPASAGANLDPSSGEPRNTGLPADGAPAVDGSDISVKASQTPKASESA